MERAPFFATKRDIAAAFKLAEESAHFRVDDVSPAASAARIRVPVFLIHGQADKETPPEHSQRVYDALTGQKRLLLVPGAGHNDALRPAVWNEIDAWIDKVLPQVHGAGRESQTVDEGVLKRRVGGERHVLHARG